MRLYGYSLERFALKTAVCLEKILSQQTGLTTRLCLTYNLQVTQFRGIVQLVERRSPKPDVVGSSPTAPVSTLYIWPSGSVQVSHVVTNVERSHSQNDARDPRLSHMCITEIIKAQWLSWLERRPVTAEVEGSSPFWVAEVKASFILISRAHSSAGRAPALQAGGHRFEPCCAHSVLMIETILYGEVAQMARAYGSYP